MPSFARYAKRIFYCPKIPNVLLHVQYMKVTPFEKLYSKQWNFMSAIEHIYCFKICLSCTFLSSVHMVYLYHTRDHMASFWWSRYKYRCHRSHKSVNDTSQLKRMIVRVFYSHMNMCLSITSKNTTLQTRESMINY